MSDGPFRQPLARRADRRFDRSIYFADSGGTPILTSRIRVVVGKDYLWLVPSFGMGDATSIPLAWLASATAVGHGLAVQWNNPVAKRAERLMFGVRGVLFYLPKERDRLVELLTSSAKSAVAPNLALPTVCEACGERSVEYYPLKRITGFLLLGSAQAEPRVLCAKHGSSAVSRTVLRNAFLGTLGPFGLVALRHAAELTELAEAKGAISSEAGSRLRYASVLIPALQLATVAAFIVFANLTV